MARKTGKDGKIEVEIGADYYAMGPLLTSTAGKYSTEATYLSDREDLQPVVRIDGTISGMSISPGSANNSVDVSAGSVYIQGTTVEVIGATVSDMIRPSSSGDVIIYALSVDSDGTINKTAGDEGTTSATRGGAGGPPFIPLNEVLIGYVTMTYLGGGASGLGVIDSTEINDESRERSTIPSYQVIYHDGDGSNPTNVGCIQLASTLPTIHAATGDGPGTAKRNVYCSYYDASFEEIPDSKDMSLDDDVTVIKSKAYGDSGEESALSTTSWSGSFTAYWSKVNDLLSLIKNSKRWIKSYPDKDETGHFAARAVVKVSRSIPVEDSLMATVTLDGSGKIYEKTS